MFFSKNKCTESFAEQNFFRLLPIQISIVAMGSINALVDGVMAGRFLDQSAVSVVGLYYTLLRILEALSGMLLGGATILCGRALGAGDLDKTKEVCTLSSALALFFGALIALLSFCIPRPLASFLGADQSLTHPLILYMQGMAIGIIPQLLGGQLTLFLQLERQDKRAQVAVIAMICSNLSLDYLLIVVFRQGILGLALATSLSNWIYMLILASFYLAGKGDLRPRLSYFHWKELPHLLQTGFPAALLVFCLSARSLVLNHLLVHFDGNDALAALSGLNMVNGLLISFCLGTASVLRMLSSIYLGEENREDLLTVVRIALTRMLLFTLGLTLLFIVISPWMASIFFPDIHSRTYTLSTQLFIIYSLGLTPTLLCLIYSNYCQAAKHQGFVYFISVVDGFLAPVLPSLLLIPLFGALGGWFSFLIGLFITLSFCLMHSVRYWGRWPKNLSEWCMLPPGFGGSEHLTLTIHRMEEVCQASEQVQRYCLSHNISPKISFHAALCLEENARNIFQHGFPDDGRDHLVEIRVVKTGEELLLRSKDNGIPFNPQECYELLKKNPDKVRNIGIRLIQALSKSVAYQNLLGLNVLTITV